LLLFFIGLYFFSSRSRSFFSVDFENFDDVGVTVAIDGDAGGLDAMGLKLFSTLLTGDIVKAGMLGLRVV
jgi:hypothetical protein